MEDENIVNIDNSNNIYEKESNFETDLLKYNFDYTSQFRTCNIKEREQKKFALNIFLMSSKINIFNKIICLYKLYEIYKEEKNFEMLYNITYKLIKYLRDQRMPNQYINMSILFSYEFLSDIQNYFYAYKSLNDIQKITMKRIDNYLNKELNDFIKIKIDTYKTIFQNILKEDNITKISEVINNIINENTKKNKNKDIDEENKGENNEIIIHEKNKENEEKDEKGNINKIIENNNIIIENNVIDINKIEDSQIQNKAINKINNDKEIKEIIDINKIENEVKKINIEKSLRVEIDKEVPLSFDNMKENQKLNQINNNYLYLINKTWLENAQKFINNYIFAKEIGNLQAFFMDAFDHEYVLPFYLSEEKITNPPPNHTFCPFPGPINNFCLTSYKDQWIDPINIEENDLVEKNMVYKKDYYLISHKEWMILQSAFSFSNIIIRTKDKIDMVQIGLVIFDRRFKKYKNNEINLFKKKVIQIPRNAFIYEFVEKIFRAVDYEVDSIELKINKNKKNKGNNYNDKNNIINNINDKINEVEDNKSKNKNIDMNIGESQMEKRQLAFYKVNKNNKDVIIEMFICFVNDILIYESVFINEIKYDENKHIEEFFKSYNPKKEILIVEILDLNAYSDFLCQIKPNPQSRNTFNCSICNKKIADLNDTKYTCELCSMYLFCSKECGKDKASKKGIEHHKLHSYLSELIFKKFNLSELFSKKFHQKIFTKENQKKNKGVLGLINLGNTCYMNCSLQCLSNTKDLTKYFLFYYFQNEVNLSNTFGTNGVLLKVYYDLIFRMWLTETNKLNPSFFRMAFCESTHKFMNSQQQDAMEFISILLNYLHEDLNRVTNKPYIQIDEQKDNESDEEASKRFWECHTLRENSIIVDLFHGQFKNIIKCQKCQKVKKTYEPFINISLPIPEEHNFYIIKFFTHLKCKYIAMNINSNTTFGELIKKATKYLSKEILDAFKNMGGINLSDKYYQRLLEDNIEIVKLDKNKIINKIYSEPENEKDIWENYQKKLLKFIGGGEEIVLFERKLVPDYCQNIYVYPIMTDQNDSEKISFLSYPVVFSVKHNLTLENLELLIFDKFKTILIDNKLNDNNKSHIIDFHILHSSKNVNTGIFKIVKEYEKCPFCKESYDSKKYCPLYISFYKHDTISKLFKFSKNYQPVVLLARSNFFDRKKKIYQDFNFEENNLINKHKNIYDSFNNLFGISESLGENNLWYCPTCKQERIIYKAIRIFKPPNYLILQLKRFKKKSEGFLSLFEGDKNETFVTYPTKNLDLSNYIDGPDKINSIYNLYAVIKHRSLMGFNHFIAYCRNNNRWIEYDDSKLNFVDNPINKEAYILFYIKKDIDEY